MNWIKEIGRAFFAGTIIFLVVGIIRYTNGVRINDGMELLISFIYNQIFAIVLYMANAAFISFLFRKFGSAVFSIRNLVRGILGGMFITFICLFLLRGANEIFVAGRNVKDFLATEPFEEYTSTLVISAIIIIGFYSFYYYKKVQETKVKEQKIIAGAASAQFDALKNQLDPHFLFNSLNVLTSLIEENPRAATKFTTALSKVYRYVLEQKNKELVTVDEELKFARLYMSLIKMRFEDSIIYDAPETISNPEARVVPLSLQLLLENAVKHNQVTPGKKLHIKIHEEDGNLVIRNNVQPKNVMKESSGVGLKNIQQRYFLLSDRPVKIQQDEKEFSIAIPMLTKKISKMKTQETYISGKKYDRAKKKVEELKGFYIHFTIYLIMVPVFIYLNFRSTSFPWAIFPILGWGMGVTGHAMEVFNYNPFLGKNWEERKIRELMNKDD